MLSTFYRNVPKTTSWIFRLPLNPSKQIFTWTRSFTQRLHPTSAVLYVRVEFQTVNQLATHYVIGKSQVAPMFDSSPHPPSFANNNAFSQCQQYRCSAEYGYNNRDRRRCKFGNCSLQPTAAQYSKQHSPNSRVAKPIVCIYNSATSSPNATGTTRAA